MAAADSDVKQIKLVCPKEVLINIGHHIRHGSALKLLNATWLFTLNRYWDDRYLTG